MIFIVMINVTLYSQVNYPHSTRNVTIICLNDCYDKLIKIFLYDNTYLNKWLISIYWSLIHVFFMDYFLLIIILSLCLFILLYLKFLLYLSLSYCLIIISILAFIIHMPSLMSLTFSHIWDSYWMNI